MASKTANAGSISFDFSSFLAGLEADRQRKIAAATLALDIFGEAVLGDAKQLCPVLTGALQASGTTLPAVQEGDRLVKTIGFHTRYAAAVHETLQANHPRGGQAKFLETALRQDAPKLGPFVAARVK